MRDVHFTGSGPLRVSRWIGRRARRQSVLEEDMLQQEELRPRIADLDPSTSRVIEWATAASVAVADQPRERRSMASATEARTRGK
jgi:hypothetical protein